MQKQVEMMKKGSQKLDDIKKLFHPFMNGEWHFIS
jgi:hypothetical protein